MRFHNSLMTRRRRPPLRRAMPRFRVARGALRQWTLQLGRPTWIKSLGLPGVSRYPVRSQKAAPPVTMSLGCPYRRSLRSRGLVQDRSLREERVPLARHLSLPQLPRVFLLPRIVLTLVQTARWDPSRGARVHQEQRAPVESQYVLGVPINARSAASCISARPASLLSNTIALPYEP